MAQLRQDHQQFVSRKYRNVAIGPEGNKAFKEWWDEHQMPFTGSLIQSTLLLILYGQQVKLIKLGRMPA